MATSEDIWRAYELVKNTEKLYAKRAGELLQEYKQKKEEELKKETLQIYETFTLWDKEKIMQTGSFKAIELDDLLKTIQKLKKESEENQDKHPRTCINEIWARAGLNRLTSKIEQAQNEWK